MKTTQLRVAVIGGGIGGLTTALALRRVGAEVRVFERAPEIKEAGAGLGVWANAVRVLDALGVGATLRRAGRPIVTAGIYSDEGRPLCITDVAALSAGLGTPSFVLHRADLLGALLAALPFDTVVTGAEVTGIDERSGEALVHFADGETYAADLVVGADGFSSVVRRHLWGDTPTRYSGQTCYRGVVRMPVARPGLLAEIQGRGRRLGHCPITRDRMYWFACHNAPRKSPEDPRGAKTKLLELFRDWPFELAQAIAATPEYAILRNDLCDRVPLTRWSRGRVTLLGDAAHPMLPNLGQGACTAIEDAAILARSLLEGRNLPEALIRYEAERIPRTTRLVELSWRFGVAARWSNPLLVAARNAMLRFVPESALHAEFLRQLDYDAGIDRLVPRRPRVRVPAELEVVS